MLGYFLISETFDKCFVLKAAIKCMYLQGVRDVAVELLHTLVAVHAEVLPGVTSGV